MSSPWLKTSEASCATSEKNELLRLNVEERRTKTRYFGGRWRRRRRGVADADKDPTCATTVSPTPCDDNAKLDKFLPPENLSNSRFSNGFLMSLKKRLRIKNLNICKAKEKMVNSETQRSLDDDKDESCEASRTSLRSKDQENDSDSNDRHTNDTEKARKSGVDGKTLLLLDEEVPESEIRRQSNNESKIDINDLSCLSNEKDENTEIFNKSGNVAEPQSTTAKRSEPSENTEATETSDISSTNDCKAKVNLSEELLKLSKYGWYWGPISGDEADSKLVGEPDGAFLVRDSSDDRYLLTLSFKSSGRLLHARLEHNGGLFSLCNQSENEADFTSVAALIDHSMNSSQSAVFCYSRPRYPGHPSFPVRLTKPVSRFTQVRSLQYLCRFVIRQNTRLDNIHKLPLPKTIRGYIEEAHY